MFAPQIKSVATTRSPSYPLKEWAYANHSSFDQRLDIFNDCSDFGYCEYDMRRYAMPDLEEKLKRTTHKIIEIDTYLKKYKVKKDSFVPLFLKYL